MDNLSVVEITREYLKKNNYDGLCQNEGECGCSLDDLFPCSPDMDAGCQAGYKVPCNPDTCSQDGDCPWHIALKKKEN